MQKDLYQHYLKHNMLEQANQCRINIEQMQCFKQESTLEDLRKELSKNNLILHKARIANNLKLSTVASVLQDFMYKLQAYSEKFDCKE